MIQGQDLLTWAVSASSLNLLSEPGQKDALQGYMLKAKINNLCAEPRIDICSMEPHLAEQIC